MTFPFVGYLVCFSPGSCAQTCCRFVVVFSLSSKEKLSRDNAVFTTIYSRLTFTFHFFLCHKWKKKQKNKKKALPMKLADVFAVGCKELNQNVNNQFAAVRWEEATQTHQTRGLWPFVCDTSMLLPYDLVQGTCKMIFIFTLTFFLFFPHGQQHIMFVTRVVALPPVPVQTFPGSTWSRAGWGRQGAAAGAGETVTAGRRLQKQTWSTAK